MSKLEIFNLFIGKSKKKQVEILWEALSIMQQYNGRSRVECIAQAMDVEIDEVE